MASNNQMIREFFPRNHLSVFFGSETRDLEPLREYRLNNGIVDIAIAPVNAVHLFGLLKLVMGGKEAIEATKVLGAKTFIPIHDSHRRRPLLISVKSSGDEAEAVARLEPDVEVVRIPTGQKWEQMFNAISSAPEGGG